MKTIGRITRFSAADVRDLLAGREPVAEEPAQLDAGDVAGAQRALAALGVTLTRSECWCHCMCCEDLRARARAQHEPLRAACRCLDHREDERCSCAVCVALMLIPDVVPPATA